MAALSPNERVQERAFALVRDELENLIARYREINGTILDADRAKELFPEYAATLESRAQFASAVYEPAQRLVDALFLRIVQAPESRGKIAVFTAGGPGSGKTALIHSIRRDLSDAAVTMDGTLSDSNRARKNIHLALAGEMRVTIYYVHRNFDEAIKGVLDRALSTSSGRTVPMSVVATKHYGAMQTLQELARSFAIDPRVAIRPAKFMGLGQSVLPCSLEEIRRDMPACLDVFIHRAYALLDARYAQANREGEIFPRKIYESLASGSPGIR